MPIDEMQPARRFPDALHGVPLRTLLGWAREPGLAPSPEIRELLRIPAVREALRDAAAYERTQQRSPRRIAA